MPRAKQHHKQGSDTDNLAQRLRIDRILRDERLQFRPLDRGTVKKYMSVFRSERTMPPVKVADLNGALILVDGWHRVAALESLGNSEVEAVVEQVASQREADWLAAKANTEHGLPLKPKEHRKVFRAFIRAKKHRRENGSFKSYREIASEIGGARGHTTIRNWMQKDFPSTFRAMAGRDEGINPNPDYTSTVSLEGIVFEALKDARAAMPAVTDPDERGRVVELLEEMLDEAKSRPWEPVPF